MKQEAPFCIQIELTQGCNLRCKFCGVTYAYKNDPKPKFMTLETAHKVADRIAESGWNPRLEFAMHGEPLLNPQWDSIIRIIRDKNPKLSILLLTNGVIVSRDGVNSIADRFFAAGGNTLGIELYRDYPYADKIINEINDELMDVFSYPHCIKANPHQRYHGKRIILIEDIQLNTEGNHAHISNHGGLSAPMDYSTETRRCYKVFKEMGICHDGMVNICCTDFMRKTNCGNIHDMTLEDIWNCELWWAYRRMLYHKGHECGICRGCDYVGSPCGLKFDGMRSAGEYTEADKQLITEGTL